MFTATLHRALESEGESIQGCARVSIRGKPAIRQMRMAPRRRRDTLRMSSTWRR